MRSKKYLCLTMSLCAIAVISSGCSQQQSVAEQASSVVANASSVVDSNEIKKSVNDERSYRVITLDNELEVVLVSDPSIEKSAAALSVGVGSYQEPLEFGGLAHYLEHMLFLGTKTYPKVGEYADFVAKNGGTINAYTQLDHTNYMIAVNNGAYNEALARFSGFFYEPLLDAKYADKERNAVHSEWSMKGPNDYVIMGALDGLTLNQDHPISQFNWGNLNSLSDKGERTLQKELLAFFDKYYSANLMKASLISNRSLDEMEVLAKKHFSVIPNNGIDKPVIKALAATPSNVNKLIRYVPQTELNQLQVKFVIANNLSKFQVKPNEYLAHLIGSEMPDTLSAKLRELGLIENLYASADPSEYGSQGSFTITSELTAGGLENRDLIVGLIFKYIALLQSKGVDEQYYQEIKQSLDNDFRFVEKYNDYAYAMRIAATLQKYEPQSVLNYAYEYERFDATEINKVLSQLTVENSRVLYIDQAQPVDTDMEYFKGRYKVETIDDSLRNIWQAKANDIELKLPSVNRLMPENFEVVKAKYTSPKLILDSKEVEVYLTHSEQFSQPKGYLAAKLNSDIDKQTAKQQVMAQLLVKSWENNVLPAVYGESRAAGMYLSVEVNNGLSAWVRGFTDKQAELLLTVFDKLQRYEVSNAELTNLKASYAAELRSNQKQIVIRQSFQTFNKLLTADEFEDSSLLSAIDSITPSELNVFKSQLFKSGKPRFFAFGNYQETLLTKTVKQLVDALPKKRVIEPVYFSPLIALSAASVVNLQTDVNMTDVGLVDASFTSLTPKAAATAMVLQKLIQPSAHKQLRTEEQLGYSVGFFSQRMREHVLMAMYIQSPVKGPNELLSRFNAFKNQFDKELATTKEESIVAIRESVLVGLVQPPKNIREEAWPFYKDWLERKTDFVSQQQLIDVVQVVTLADVQALYGDLNSEGKLSRVVVQLRGTEFKDAAFAEFKQQQKVASIDAFHKKSL
ncbi:insulinase family protein [Shewanella sp. KX20019]|uniref:insulinase family protein n=1 Tax=Shewanella sp. KX20019 TaxID=2803864 RepID=UPI0019288948|nr:insulinase family protein [Shewanella sp. KX20019]QQX79498.1 insulinase family protein [Shewanella sp. KX20019]